MKSVHVGEIVRPRQEGGEQSGSQLQEQPSSVEALVSGRSAKGSDLGVWEVSKGTSFRVVAELEPCHS